MNTNEIRRATVEQQKIAHQIWSDLDALVVERNGDVSDIHFYAVWGLINAILNNRDWTADAYTSWVDRLHKVWAEVQAQYKA